MSIEPRKIYYLFFLETKVVGSIRHKSKPQFVAQQASSMHRHDVYDTNGVILYRPIDTKLKSCSRLYLVGPYMMLMTLL